MSEEQLCKLLGRRAEAEYNWWAMRDMAGFCFVSEKDERAEFYRTCARAARRRWAELYQQVESAQARPHPQIQEESRG